MIQVLAIEIMVSWLVHFFKADPGYINLPLIKKTSPEFSRDVYDLFLMLDLVIQQVSLAP